MKEIQLNKNLIALVDDEDFTRLREYSWIINSSGYPIAHGRGKMKYMHRFILNLTKEDKVSVDHINGNKLDNRKENLRLCTQSINMFNSKTSSKYRGVSKSRTKNKWRAYINKNRKQISLGYYDSESAAYEAYKKAALELYGFLPYDRKAE